MTVVLMEKMHGKRESQHRLALDKATRDAVSDLARRQWPLKTASYAAQAWRLTESEARGVVAARASQTTIDKIFKNGGWSVIFPVMAEVIGQSADAYLIEKRAAHEDHARRLAALCGDSGSMPAPRHSDPPDDRSALDERPRSFGGRARSR